MIFFLNLNKNENFYNHKNDQILYFDFFLIILHGIMVNILSYSIHIFSILKYVFCLLFLPSFLIVFIHIDQNLE